MLKMKSILSVQINEKDYEFYCDPNSPLQDALNANNQINAFLLGKIEQTQQAQKVSSEEQLKSG